MPGLYDCGTWASHFLKAQPLRDCILLPSFAAKAAAHPSVQGERNPHADHLLFLSDSSFPLHVLVLCPTEGHKPVPSAIQDPCLVQCGQCLPHRSPALLVLSAVQEGSRALWHSPSRKGWISAPWSQAVRVPLHTSCLFHSVFYGPNCALDGLSLLGIDK